MEDEMGKKENQANAHAYQASILRASGVPQEDICEKCLPIVLKLLDAAHKRDTQTYIDALKDSRESLIPKPKARKK
jgi:hypothetical protein